jgi:hypothetical protein
VTINLSFYVIRYGNKIETKQHKQQQKQLQQQQQQQQQKHGILY